MSEVVEFNKIKRVRDEASVWLVRLQEGLSQSQRRELTDWLALDKIHETQLLELAAVWDELEVLTELAPLFEGMPVKSTASDRAPEQAKSGWLRVGVAASVLMACGVVAFLYDNGQPLSDLVGRFSNSSSESITAPLDTVVPVAEADLRVFQTPIGEQLEVQLSDGSKATLNTDTRIEVSFTKTHRRIMLYQGEAHFSVFKDSDRPLVVRVSGKSVQAVGTAFSVRKNTDSEIVVAVDEGRVAVYRHGLDLQSDDHMAPTELEASLDAGEVLTIIDDEQRLVQYDLEEMEDRLAWRRGMIVINDETLDYVINEFGRYSEKKMLLADRKMGEIRVAGYFRLGDIDALLVALEENFSIRSEYYEKNDTFVLSQL